MDASPSKDASPCAVGFIGDLADPWVAAIADSIAVDRSVDRKDRAGPLPAWPFEGADPPRAAVIHRHRLGPTDARRLEEWRARPTLLYLCVSPYVRYEDLERWSGLFERVISEASAAEVLPGQLARRLDGKGRRRPSPATPPFRLEVAGGDDELNRTLVDACVQAGYPARPIEDQEIGGHPPTRPRDRPGPAERVLTIWEFPVLEPGWHRRLEWRARQTGPVIGLAGFADRAIVARARQAGAVACLDLPCDLDDLIDAVDRTVAATPPDAWPMPARVEPAHVLPPPRRNARRDGKPMIAASHWPDRGPLPTILTSAGSGRGTEPPPAKDPVVPL